MKPFLLGLDTSFVPKIVLDDPLWRRCMELALRSKGKEQCYGSVVTKNDKIIGEGWNRLLGRGEPFPFRTSFFLHAEKAAIGQALLREKNIDGAILCVSGFFVEERRPIIFKEPIGTCVNCAKLYPQFGIDIWCLTPQGRVLISGKSIYEIALAKTAERKKRNLTTKEFRTELSL